MINKFRGKYAFLSNFYSCNIEFCGMSFGSVEAAYQGSKSGNPADLSRFQGYDAMTAKREGKKLEIRPQWDKTKFTLMYNLLLRKFDNRDLQEKLLATGDEELVEGNDWGDTEWGVCNGIGENQLGKLLMKVREYYRNFE